MLLGVQVFPLLRGVVRIQFLQLLGGDKADVPVVSQNMPEEKAEITEDKLRFYVKANNTEYIINKLEQAGYEAFAVGGCVRDTLMGRTPGDWDICTNALPEQTMQVFEGFHVIPTGLQHGTVTVMINHNGYEITTYRIDGSYSDGRHPDSVSFTGNLKEDLARDILPQISTFLGVYTIFYNFV